MDGRGHDRQVVRKVPAHSTLKFQRMMVHASASIAAMLAG